MKFYPGDIIQFGSYQALVLTPPDIFNNARVKELGYQRECNWTMVGCTLVTPISPQLQVRDRVVPRVELGQPFDTLSEMILGEVFYCNIMGTVDIRILEHPNHHYIGQIFNYIERHLLIKQNTQQGYTPSNEFMDVDLNHYFLPGDEVVIDPLTYTRSKYSWTNEEMITGQVLEMLDLEGEGALQVKIIDHVRVTLQNQICEVNPLYFKLKNPQLSSTMFNENDIIAFNPESTGGKEIYKYINAQMKEAQILEMREDGRLIRVQVVSHEDVSKVGFITLVDAKYFTRIREAEKITITLITGEEVTYAWREHRVLKSGKYALKSDSSLVQISEHWYHPSEFDEFNISLDNNTGRYNFTANMKYGVIDTRGSLGFFSGSGVEYAIQYDEDGNVDDPLYEEADDLEDLFGQGEYIRFMNTSVAEHYNIVNCPAMDRYVHRSQYQERSRRPQNTNDYRFGYHSCSDKNFSGNSIYRIGVEVEKEDAEAMVLATADAMYVKHGWRKERDGSLNDSTGFEFISPIYDLYDENGKMEKDFETDIIIQHLNAAYSERCGM